MDLNSIETLLRPTKRAELPARAEGDAFLAGGTYLFSEPQPRLRRLIALDGFGWTPIEIAPGGVRVAATCTLAQLAAAEMPPSWPATSLFAESIDALWGSFKVHKAATVGGNLCLALPAGPIAALATALDATCEIWTTDGDVREMAALDFVVGDTQNALEPGEILRAITFPAPALLRRAAFRQTSLTAFGRSAALVIGTRAPGSPARAITITAAVKRAVRVAFPSSPDTATLAAAIDAAIPDALLHDDIHGAPGWRRHMTHALARDVVEALA